VSSSWDLSETLDASGISIDSLAVLRRIDLQGGEQVKTSIRRRQRSLDLLVLGK
jgi:hypothetical protein